MKTFQDKKPKKGSKSLLQQKLEDLAFSMIKGANESDVMEDKAIALKAATQLFASIERLNPEKEGEGNGFDEFKAKSSEGGGSAVRLLSISGGKSTTNPPPKSAPTSGEDSEA